MERVTLFEDIFEITAVNPDGYKFDLVNRLQGTGATFDCELLLDINCDIYRVVESDKVSLALATTLHLDGSPADHFSYNPSSHATEPSLADNYDYVMHGRVFNIKWCVGKNWESYFDLETQQYKWHCTRECGCGELEHKKYDRFVIIAISFGGLLMRLTGEPKHLESLYKVPDQRLYLLLKKD